MACTLTRVHDTYWFLWLSQDCLVDTPCPTKVVPYSPENKPPPLFDLQVLVRVFLPRVQAPHSQLRRQPETYLIPKSVENLDSSSLATFRTHSWWWFEFRPFHFASGCCQNLRARFACAYISTLFPKILAMPLPCATVAKVGVLTITMPISH